MSATADAVLAVAVRAARRAAAVIVDASRDLRRLPAFSREHGDIVSGADSEARAAIAATIAAAFPEHVVTTDADGDGRGDFERSSRRWIVDAIDGTMNFAHGYPCFATSLALVEGAELSHAVVLDPMRDELFTAVRGMGAQLNGAPVRTSVCTRLDDALVGSALPPRRSSRLATYLPVFGALAERCGVRRAGACSLDLAYVAAGRLDGFWAMNAGPWNVAAGALLVIEAGGRVGDFAGAPTVVRSQDVIAAAPGVFNALRETIASSLARST